MTYDLYTDEQLVNGLINNNKKIIEYFFCKKCSVDVAIIKTEEGEVYVVVNKRFELFFGTISEEDVG